MRERIGATRAEGFVLSSEPPPRSRHGLSARRSLGGAAARVGMSAVVLQRSQLEAAARMWMWEDFDPNLFDALCVCLQVTRHEPLRRAPTVLYRAMSAQLTRLTENLEVTDTERWETAREGGRRYGDAGLVKAACTEDDRGSRHAIRHDKAVSQASQIPQSSALTIQICTLCTYSKAPRSRLTDCLSPTVGRAKRQSVPAGEGNRQPKRTATRHGDFTKKQAMADAATVAACSLSGHRRWLRWGAGSSTWPRPFWTPPTAPWPLLSPSCQTSACRAWAAGVRVWRGAPRTWEGVENATRTSFKLGSRGAASCQPRNGSRISSAR